MQFAELVLALAEVAGRRESAEIERACEAALQGGEHGVLVVRDDTRRLISAEVNRLVPYGTIYEVLPGVTPIG